jgi:hypothetical protein
MKRNSYLDAGFLRRRALSFVSACVLACPAALFAQQYQQTNLVSDLGTLGAQTVDPNLKNPWGIARGPSGILGGSPTKGAEFPRSTTRKEHRLTP